MDIWNTLLGLCFLAIVVLIAVLAWRAGYLDFLRPVFAGFEREGALRRMWPLWLLFVLCFAVVLLINPMKAGLTLYGIGKIALGGLIGYVIDYCAYREQDRPHNLEGIERGTAWKRRAWIICAAILAMALVP